ncbi:MAG: class I tRNA ligase family protein, partial [Bacteroidaceae bacterium]|nr:class I tRNA ligase family protein [Bacteroidaceae bacterium]
RVLEPLVALIAPFCPHIAEELWEALGHSTTVCDAPWPEFNEKFLVETTVKMPVQFNGKVRFTLDLPADMAKEEIEKTALTAPEGQKYLEGMQVVKIVVVPGRIINIVIKPA